MGGALAQLSSVGVADAFLTASPQITYFKSIWRRHTNFSLEAIDQVFDGTADFGRKATVQLSRNGDLVSRVWLQVTLPDLAAYDITPAPAEGNSVDVTAAAQVTTSTAAQDLQGTAATLVYKKSSTIFAYEKSGRRYTDAALTSEIKTWPYMVASGNTYVVPTALVRWCNSVGHALVSSVELEIGGQRIDRHFSEWWDIWSELSEKEEKRAGLWSMVGKYDATAYDTYAREHAGPRTLFIPLTFCFNRHAGLALPLVALAYHAVKFNFEFRPYLECINSTVPVTALTSKEGAMLPTLGDIRLYAEYVFLDTPERRRFATMPHEMLVEQLQFLGDEAVLPSAVNRKFQLNFNHPVKELVWVYVPKAHYDVDPETGNRLFDYFIPGSPDVDVFDTAKIVLNGNDRISERPAGYFKRVQPYQHHTRCPAKNVYVYSFALTPEDVQPSGSCNFSRIDSAQLQLKLRDDIELGRVKIYALSYNVVRIQSGMAGLSFSN